MQYLRQSTASQEISLGYFLDSTDGNTEETALTIANTDIKLRKGGTTTLANKNSGGATHISNGVYHATLDATDTNTLGMLEVYVHVAGALPVKATYMVIPAATYDALVTNGLNDVSAADVNAQCDTALADYDAPTKAELDSGLAALNDLDAAGIRTAVGLASANLDTQLSAIVTDTNELQTNQGNWLTATGFSTHSAADVADAVLDEVLAGHTTAGTLGKALADVETDVTSILADTGELQTNQGNWLTATGFSTHSAADVADAVLDEALAGHVTAGTLGKAIADIETDATAILADTNELQTNQGNWLTATGFATSAALATVDANVDAILVDTGTDIPARFDGIEGATFSSATDSLEALRDRGDSAWTTGAGGTPPQLLQNTTIATLASQTSFTLTAGSADNDAYNGAVVVVTDSATSTQKAVGSVLDYVGSTKTITLTSDPGIFTMAVGDTIDIIANASTAPTAAAVRAEIDANSTQLAAILADTNELQTDDIPGLIAALNDPTVTAIADAVLDEALSGHVTAGTLGKAIADIETDVTAILADTNELQTNQGNWLTATGFATSAALATVDSNVDAILVDTGTTLPASLATIDSNVDAILVDTGTTLPATLSTIDGIVDAILVDTGTTLPATLATLATASSLATVDTVVDAIKVKTDSLTFTTAGQVDANIQYVNDVQVTGDGGSGTEWGPTP